MQHTRVLVIDDEADIRKLIRATIETAELNVLEASSGADALRAITAEPPDVIILDIMMSDMSGYQVLRKLPRNSKAYVIILSGLTDTASRMEALELGADDYITKPFKPEELTARIRSRLGQTRHNAFQDHGDDYDDGYLTISNGTRLISVAGQEIMLPPKEFDLLYELVTNAGKTLTSEHILTRIWGEQFKTDTGLLYPHIARLRAKIEPDPSQPEYIITVQRIGYRFKSDPH